MPPLAEFAALLTALSAFIGGVVLAYRGLRSDKFKREVEASAAILTGYNGMISTLQAEIARMQKRLDEQDRRHEEDLIQWEQERQRWREERSMMRQRIDNCEDELRVLRGRDGT